MTDTLYAPENNADDNVSTVRNENVFGKGQLNGEKTRVIYHYSVNCHFCRQFQSTWNRTVLNTRLYPSVDFRSSPYRGVGNYPDDFYKSPAIPTRTVGM